MSAEAVTEVAVPEAVTPVGQESVTDVTTLEAVTPQ